MIIYNLNTNKVTLDKDEYGGWSVDGRIIDAINSAAERLGYSKQLTERNRNMILRYLGFWGYGASINGFLDMGLENVHYKAYKDVENIGDSATEMITLAQNILKGKR